MAIQFLTYDDNNMESGKFYLIEANLDNASNIREINSIIGPLQQATQDITELKGKNDFQDIEIYNLKDYFENYKYIIVDNQARINNLEDTEINKIVGFLDQISIRKNFQSATQIEIDYGRKEIACIKVYVVKTSSNNKIVYQEISSTLLIENEIYLDLNGNPTNKKIVIKSNQPITGYALVL